MKVVTMKCPECTSEMLAGGLTSEVYQQGALIVSVTGIPAVFICPNCQNAIIEWETAQEVEELVKPILSWPGKRSLPSPAIAIAFPTLVAPAVLN